MKESDQTSLMSGKITDNAKGFSLLEVLIAVTIFAIFISAFVISQGQNLSDSAKMQEELALRKLAEDVLNEIILSPPDYSPSLALSKETKSFEDDYSNFEYTIEYKKVEVPNFAKLANQGANSKAAEAAIQEQIFEQFKDNIEKMLWQVSITIRNKDSDYIFTISSWLRNNKAEVKITL